MEPTNKLPSSNSPENPDLRPILPTSNVIWVVLYSSAMGAFFALGGAYLSVRPHSNIYAWVLLFLGFVALGLNIRRILLNNRAKHPIRKGWPTGWCVIIMFLGGSGCVLGYLLEGKQPAPFYSVSVEPILNDKSQNPFDTFMRVKNTSASILYNVKFSGWWHETNGVTRYGLYEFASHIVSPKMDPGAMRDWRLNLPEDAPHTVEPNTECTIVISFSLATNSPVVQSNLFQFQIIKEGDHFVWVPEDEGKKYSDVLAESMFPTNLDNRANWRLAMAVLSATDFTLSCTNGDRDRLWDLHCVVTNGGGQMASNVSLKWQLFNPFIGKLKDFGEDTNYVPYRLLPKAFMPDDTWINDLPPPGDTNTFYDIVVSGRRILIGTLTYNDQLGYDYRYCFFVVPENGAFGILPFSVTAPFNHLKMPQQ